MTLTEKRETKRYYIRPQDIFCANKADVLKGLIEVADSGENCTVYSLKNLDDHDDIHKLTNHDIIYYYDDNVLYDKNHVLVMDYDLFIKHEEERPELHKKPIAITKQDYDNHYDDRMTKETVVEGLSKDGFALALDKDEDICVGNIVDEDKLWMSFDDGEPYSQTDIHIVKDNDSYVIYRVDVSSSGDSIVDESSNESFDTVDEAIAALAKLNLSDCEYDLISNAIIEQSEDLDNKNNIFDTKFENYSLNTLYNKIYESFDDEVTGTCVICGDDIIGHGNNAEPYKKGKCCDACNLKFVIPARLEHKDEVSEDEDENTDEE